MISDKKLTVVFRNFYRNRMVNLSALSVKHFLPNADIHCLTLYKESMSEYTNQERLSDYITEFTDKTKYVSKNQVHDHVDSSKTSGYGNSDNGQYFAEGYNLIFEKFRGTDEPVLILAEDHFFTTGATLKELVDTDWDAAYADGDSPDCSRANGSIVGIVPSRVSWLFPMTEYENTTVEWMVGNLLLRQLPQDRVHRLTTRNWIDYCGDGIYTNSSEVMEVELKKAGIL